METPRLYPANSLSTSISTRFFQRIAILLGLFSLGWTASAQVRIEIINDSGKADSQVFVKAPGKYWPGVTNAPITPLDLFVDIEATNPPQPSSLSLTNLPVSGTRVSAITGKTNTVYFFTAEFIKSGSIYFTYDRPFTFTNSTQPSPPPDSLGNALRYDYAELSINNSTSQYNAIDLTYVDKFGIPLQMEWLRGTSIVSGSYVYASTKTLVNQFRTNGLSGAVFALGATNIAPGWAYSGPDSYTNFARILSPQKVSGTGVSVAPYQDVSAYLNSLVGADHAFSLNGASPQGGYYFVGYTVTITNLTNGWMFTLKPSGNPPRFDAQLITGTQYTNVLSFPVTFSEASRYVYGAPVGTNLYLINGQPATNSDSATYPAETWMIGDVLSSLNFGFWGGRYGKDSSDWYSRVGWSAFPFGSARLTNDGYYNTYTALIYNNADPYGFAFSERITPDVLMAPDNGDRIQITILPDDRLDSPVVATPTGSAITTNSIALNWAPIQGATGYRVNVLRPLGQPSVDLPSTASGYTFTNLQPGTPYVMSVQALGPSSTITPARAVAATTAGAVLPAQGNLTQIQVTFSVADPFYQLGKVQINGVELLSTNSQWLTTNGVPARWIASAGLNQAVVTVVDTNNQVLFNDWLTFELATPFPFTNGAAVTLNSAITNVVLHGQKLSQPPPGVAGFLGTNWTAANFPTSTQNPSLSIGLSYIPAETRRYAPVKSTGSGTQEPPSIRLKDHSLLGDGTFQFHYSHAGTQELRVYGSTNLSNWVPVGVATQIAPGQFRFIDSNAPNFSTRHYHLRSIQP